MLCPLSLSLSNFFLLPFLCLHVSWIGNHSHQGCQKAINIPQSLLDSKQALTNPKNALSCVCFLVGQVWEMQEPTPPHHSKNKILFSFQTQTPPNWCYLLLLRLRDKAVKETSKITYLTFFLHLVKPMVAKILKYPYILKKNGITHHFFFISHGVRTSLCAP